MVEKHYAVVSDIFDRLEVLEKALEHFPVVVLGNFVNVRDQDKMIQMLTLLERKDVAVVVGPIEARLVLDATFHPEYKKTLFYRRHVYPFLQKCKVVTRIEDTLLSAGTIERGWEEKANRLWAHAIRYGEHGGLLSSSSPIFSQKTWNNSTEWQFSDVPYFRDLGARRFVCAGPESSGEVFNLQVMNIDGVTTYKNDMGESIAIGVGAIDGFIEIIFRQEGDLVLTFTWCHHRVKS